MGVRRAAFVILVTFLFAPAAAMGRQSDTGPDLRVARVVTALLGDTPLLEDLRFLSDDIGGRATGSPANLRAVEWALERFRDAGVTAQREAFTMPALWLENASSGTVRGAGVEFEVRLAAMPFSTGTPPEGITAPLVDAGTGADEDFTRLGPAARGAFLLVETTSLTDIDGLFREYGEAYATERRARAAGALGVVYMGSRAEGVLYRHNSSLLGPDARPMLIMERRAARRARDLLRAGTSLTLTARIDLQTGGPYESYNVIGEIRGASRAEEIVLIGAHLDSWDLGGGALDNGANVALVLDVARQMARYGIRPDRTIRFALWNGEEEGLVGSQRYTEDHADELDRHVMAMAFDIGCGLINGFYTGGRPEILPAVDAALEPVRGLGPFIQIDAPIVGTDNFDFMMQGVANLVGNQEPASYGLNYHAETDQFDKCDGRTLRLNAAIVAALTLGIADGDVTWGRQSREAIEDLVATTDLEEQMRMFSVWDGWANGTRGRRR